METITRTLRSQVCLGETTEPITAGNDNGVTFYANLSNNPDAAQRRTLLYDPATKQITESIYTGIGTYPDLTFPSTPTRQRGARSRASAGWSRSSVTQPIFRFFTFKTGATTGELQQLPVPLASTDVSRVVMVKVAFFAKPIKPVPTDPRRDQPAERRLRAARRPDRGRRRDHDVFDASHPARDPSQPAGLHDRHPDGRADGRRPARERRLRRRRPRHLAVAPGPGHQAGLRRRRGRACSGTSAASARTTASTSTARTSAGPSPGERGAGQPEVERDRQRPAGLAQAARRGRRSTPSRCCRRPASPSASRTTSTR